jgi:hypothetical protein
VAIAFWRRSKAKHRTSDYVFLFVFAPVALVVAGFLKVSTMLLLLAAGVGIGLLGRLFRDRAYALSAFIAFAVSGITYKLVSVSAQNQGVVPFAYMRAQIDPSWWPYFLLAHLFWSVAYIVLRLREEGLYTVGGLRLAALGGKITDVVVVAVVALAGWSVGEVLDIHGGSAVYFSDVQRWLALSLIMASAWRWLSSGRAVSSNVEGARIRWGGLRLSRVLVILLLIPLSITVLLNAMRAPETALRANIALRRGFLAEANAPAGRFRSLANASALSVGLHRSPEYPLISTLRALDRMDPAVKRKTAVFIPQSDTAFWHIWKEPERCSYVPFIVPAVSGLSLVDGMPPTECDLTLQYGMTRYTRRATTQSADELAPQGICAKAQQKGFSRVVVLTHRDSISVDEQLLVCPLRIAEPG